MADTVFLCLTAEEFKDFLRSGLAPGGLKKYGGGAA
jgi:hypothetical protein